MLDFAKVKRYYISSEKMIVRVASSFAKRLKTWNLRKLENIKNNSRMCKSRA